MILLAYFLNTIRILEHRRRTFHVMNIIGAVLACYAAWQLRYASLVVIGVAWVLVSIYGLMRAMRIKMT